MKIAVDAMGGDRAPAVVVKGAVLAAQEIAEEIILIGQKDIVEKELSVFKKIPSNISLVHAGSSSI